MGVSSNTAKSWRYVAIAS